MGSALGRLACELLGEPVGEGRAQGVGDTLAERGDGRGVVGCHSVLTRGTRTFRRVGIAWYRGTSLLTLQRRLWAYFQPKRRA